MPKHADQPADPIIAPIKAQRERIEKGGTASDTSDHIAHAQRAYLYALHGAAGALCIAVPASALIIFASLFVTRSPHTARPVLFGTFSLSVLAWFVWVRALRMLIGADPAYRISGMLFVVRKSVMPAALIAGFAAGVLLASRLSPSASGLAPVALMFVLIAASSAWITILTAWRTRSLLGRCAGGQDAVCSDIGAIVLIVASILALIASGSTNTVLHAVVAIIALLGAFAMMLALLRLRSRVGGIMRDMEQAEPGPAFEPVGSGS